jgi:putative tricarboxylic transport membrane protein
MDVLNAIALGFATALTWQNLIYCFVGVFVGTVIGVLPGLGPVPTISLLLPFSFTMNVASAVIMMAGIYYGAQYGGSITAILVRIPGEASAVVTCLDGYAMARQGRAAPSSLACWRRPRCFSSAPRSRIWRWPSVPLSTPRWCSWASS